MNNFNCIHRLSIIESVHRFIDVNLISIVRVRTPKRYKKCQSLRNIEVTAWENVIFRLSVRVCMQISRCDKIKFEFRRVP